MPLPILIPEEGALSPRLGYVFQRRWVQPYESVLGMLWKFARVNRLPGHLVVAQLCGYPVDPYEGIASVDIDVRRVARLLGITLRNVRDGIGTAAADASPFVRYCTRCSVAGYHCRLFQFERHTCCPIHGAPLRIECRSCGRPSAYRFDAQLLDAPFRCRYCGRYYTCIGGAPAPTGRYLVHKERVAVTRAAFG